MQTQATAVETLQVGQFVDMESCPYLKAHPSAPFEFAQVAYVERETPTCVVIGYEGIDHVGYEVGTLLNAVAPKVGDIPA